MENIVAPLLFLFFLGPVGLVIWATLCVVARLML